jgi:hypothetical protein
MADETASTTSTSGSSVMDTASDLYNTYKDVVGSTPVKGAALGALMSNLLSQYKEPGGVARPIDLSQLKITPRATTFSPARYVPYSQYGTRSGLSGLGNEQIAAMGGIPGLAPAISSQAMSAIPEHLISRPPVTVTSAGSGSQVIPTVTLTPRSTQNISPLTGALLGAAAGYLFPSQTSGGGGGGTGGTGGTSGGGGGNSLIDAGLNWITDKASSAYKWLTGSSGKTPVGDFVDSYGRIVTQYSDGSYSNPVSLPNTPSSSYFNSRSSSGSGSSSYWNAEGGLISQNMANGGMATPLMADGGMTPEPSYYTYGTAINPRQIMQQLAQDNYTNTEFANGGYAQGGLHVPTVEGRHDYRSGSRVSGDGDGQSDDIPAMLADGEYVFDADTVAQLGNGSTKAGSDLLDKFREEIRTHKRSAPVDKIPPPSKSPLQYLKQAQARSKKHG